MEKEKETHNYLSKEEIKEKVHKYNSAVTDKLKMTLVSTLLPGSFGSHKKTADGVREMAGGGDGGREGRACKRTSQQV